MRDILFKAKRIDNNKWIKGLLIIIRGQYHIINPNDEYTAYPIDSDTICQYTGLTDKNGNKIWENDLVGVLTEDGNFKVTWSDTEARYKMESESDCFTVTFDEYWSYEVEVVGNVFDTLWTR